MSRFPTGPTNCFTLISTPSNLGCVATRCGCALACGCVRIATSVTCCGRSTSTSCLATCDDSCETFAKVSTHFCKSFPIRVKRMSASPDRKLALRTLVLFATSPRLRLLSLAHASSCRAMRNASSREAGLRSLILTRWLPCVPHGVVALIVNLHVFQPHGF